MNRNHFQFNYYIYRDQCEKLTNYYYGYKAPWQKHEIIFMTIILYDGQWKQAMKQKSYSARLFGIYTIFMRQNENVWAFVASALLLPFPCLYTYSTQRIPERGWEVEISNSSSYVIIWMCFGGKCWLKRVVDIVSFPTELPSNAINISMGEISPQFDMKSWSLSIGSIIYCVGFKSVNTICKWSMAQTK